MRLLFTSPIIEYPPAGGPQLRIANSIKALARVSDLYVLARTTPELLGGHTAAQYFSGISKEFDYLPPDTKGSKNRYLRKLGMFWDGLMERVTHKQAIRLLDFVRKWNIDAVWFGYGNLSYPLIRSVKARRPDLKVVCDTDSVWSRFVLRELPYENSMFKRMILRYMGWSKKREERKWVHLCEATTAVSEVDAVYYREISRYTNRIHVFSNVIDMDAYRVQPPPAADLRTPGIYLAGTFGRDNSPMNMAAQWMLDDVMPRVRKHVPEATLYLVGRNSDSSFGHIRDPRVVVKGRLDSVLPYLCHASVVVVPLKYESGTRFKILEAGACGIPVVSTSLGAEGLPVEDGIHLLLADDSESFARAIVSLLHDRNLASSLAENCRSLVGEYFGIERHANEARAILGNLKTS